MQANYKKDYLNCYKDVSTIPNNLISTFLVKNANYYWNDARNYSRELVIKIMTILLSKRWLKHISTNTK